MPHHPNATPVNPDEINRVLFIRNPRCSNQKLVRQYFGELTKSQFSNRLFVLNLPPNIDDSQDAIANAGQGGDAVLFAGGDGTWETGIQALLEVEDIMASPLSVGSAYDNWRNLNGSGRLQDPSQLLANASVIDMPLMDLSIKTQDGETSQLVSSYVGLGLDADISFILNGRTARQFPGRRLKAVRKGIIEPAAGIAAMAASEQFSFQDANGGHRVASQLFLNGPSFGGHCHFPVNVDEERIFMNSLESLAPADLMPWLIRALAPQQLERHPRLAALANSLNLSDRLQPTGTYLENGDNYSLTVGETPVRLQSGGETQTEVLQPGDIVTIRQSSATIRAIVANNPTQLAA